MTRRLSLACGLALLSVATIAARGATPATAVAPNPVLAVVNGDTIRLSSLESELLRMKSRRVGDAPLVLPAAADVLRRLVQNELIAQEGYRLGYDKNASVRQQVSEAARQTMEGALLDSVASAVPAGGKDRLEAKKAAAKAFIDQVKARQGVKIDEKLLASLDFGSADTLVQKKIRESNDVVAITPTGKLTVRGLARNIRFTYFHGLQGRKDAKEIRDRFLDDWVTQSVLAVAARQRGWDRRPEVIKSAKLLERDLVREETITAFTSFSFKPADKEIEAYYRQHAADFSPPTRVKVESALFASEGPAKEFCDRLRQGAKFRWLLDRTTEAKKDVHPFPIEWIEPAALGLKPEDLVVGKVLDTYGVPGGWAVAAIAEVERPAPAALATVRDQVVGRMKLERTRQVLTEALRRLEAAAQIQTAPDAAPRITAALAAAKAEAEADTRAKAEADAKAAAAAPAPAPKAPPKTQPKSPSGTGAKTLPKTSPQTPSKASGGK